MVRESPEKRYDPRGTQQIKKRRFVFDQKSKVSFDFFNLLYFLVPGFIFDQKIEILSKLNMRWAKISWILVIFVFSFFEIFKIVTRHLSFDTQRFDRIFQFTLFFGPRIDFWPENRVPEWIKHAISPNIMNFGDFWFHFFQHFENCKSIWNLIPKVSIEFFNLLYFLLPKFILDQKIEFLSEFWWQSA